MPHNPNPFDFVPFSDGGPILRTPEQFDAMGAHYSGYLEVTLKTLTALHIVGAVQQVGNGAWTSKLLTQNGVPVVPAATIRGCLRSFVEALCSGWVSKANDKKNNGTYVYDKSMNNRHIGFRPFDAHPSNGRTMQRNSPPAIDSAFKPAGNDALDVAAYLFGQVLEGAQGGEATARRGKVWIEDAVFLSQQTDITGYWRPDVKKVNPNAQGDPFMGGGKPNASNWWYMKPAEVWSRHVHLRGGFDVAEFVGEKFRGRKFYFHQDPQKCVEYYDPKSGKWEYGNKVEFTRIPMKCIKPTELSQTFRVYIDHLPKHLLHLLVLALMPGDTIRHKMGYGKAYGYGSVEFTITAAHLRAEVTPPAMPAPLTDEKAALIDAWIADGWDENTLERAGIEQFIDRIALQWLARILGWPAVPNLLFTYPHFNPPPNEPDKFKPRFRLAIQSTEWPGVTSTGIAFPATGAPYVVPNPAAAETIAKGVASLKTPVDFRHHQESAAGWAAIARRRP